MTQEQKAIDELRSKGHTIGDPYYDDRSKRVFVVVDGVAMSPGITSVTRQR